MHEASNKATFVEMVREATKHALHPEISLAAGTIHNPIEARHFMSLRNVPGRVTILKEAHVLADSSDALVCLEVGKQLYLPVYYLPVVDVCAEMKAFDRSTHCPLKGDASYHALPGENAPIAWSYDRPFPYAEPLARRIAFNPAQVTITLSPD